MGFSGLAFLMRKVRFFGQLTQSDDKKRDWNVFIDALIIVRIANWIKNISFKNK